MAKGPLAFLLFAPSWAWWHALRSSPSQSGTSSGIILTPSNVTFREFYYGHSTGRGIWKWSCALDAYQRHLGPLAGRSLAVGEVGIQSGGSLDMWKAVLGSACHVYGIDINPACLKFADTTTSITIGDQGNMDTWNRFFASMASQLDALVDDGSHQAEHMGMSLHWSFPYLKPGGLVAIEDTNGQHFVSSFYCQFAAKSIGAFSAMGQVASVHVYPLMLIVHKVGGDLPPSIPPSAVTVDNLSALWSALPQHPGGFVAFENPAWGSFLSEVNACAIFTVFQDLHSWAATFTPPGGQNTHDAACRADLANSHMQHWVKGVHIFPTSFVVEVAESPPVLEAVRMGTEWLAWYGNVFSTPSQPSFQMQTKSESEVDPISYGLDRFS